MLRSKQVGVERFIQGNSVDMKNMLLTLVLLAATPTTEMQFNFGKKDVNNWVVVLDGVMGGRSTGTASFTEKSMVLEGQISLENNGGFASIRSPWGSYDLSEAKGIRIKLKGDGRKHTLMLEPTKQWYLPTYVYDIKTKEKWQTIDIPVKDLRISQVGKQMEQGPSRDDLKAIKRMGFILFDKQSGPYRLEVASIEIY